MKNNDFATWKQLFVRQFYVFATWCAGKQSKTTISRFFRSTVLRFCIIKTIFVRQFYVFATLMSGKQSKTTISRNFRSTLLRFCNTKTIFVRQFYVFETLMSGQQSKTTIPKPKCATVLRFCYQNTAKAIFGRQFYILSKKCRFYCVFTCFCDFLASEAMLEHKRAKKKTPQMMRRASETRFRDVL